MKENTVKMNFKFKMSPLLESLIIKNASMPLTTTTEILPGVRLKIEGLINASQSSAGAPYELQGEFTITGDLDPTLVSGVINLESAKINLK